MDCVRVRELLLELPETAAATVEQAGVTAHLADCPDCQRLHQALTRVDEGLSGHLRAPVLDPGFAARFDARLARERRRLWADWLPAAVHFASCGAATAICVAVLPDRAGIVLATAASVTVVSHFLLTTAHTVLDASGD